MTVKDLINKLKEMPEDAQVFCVYDGRPYINISLVYESKDGNVITCGYGELCYDNNARPKGAPTAEEDLHWHLEDGPNLIDDEDF